LAVLPAVDKTVTNRALRAEAQFGKLGQLPLQWTISQPKRLAVAVAKGEVRPREMVDFLAAIDDGGARPYGKLVFVEQFITTFSEERYRPRQPRTPARAGKHHRTDRHRHDGRCHL